MVTTELLGKAQVPNVPYTDFDGRRIELDTDYFGKKRNMKKPTPGPFESIPSGRQKIKVWPNGEERDAGYQTGGRVILLDNG
jgi:alpha-N-arabinofuranosidase